MSSQKRAHVLLLVDIPQMPGRTQILLSINALYNAVAVLVSSTHVLDAYFVCCCSATILDKRVFIRILSDDSRYLLPELIGITNLGWL